jgi:protein-S-isoprenylcysteine O-methyltransferase Ste14
LIRGPASERWFAAGQAVGAAALGFAVATHPQSSRPIQVVAAVALSTSILVGILAWIQLRHSFQVAPSPRADGRLERSGIYRVLRHPMYFAVQVCALAAVLWRPSALALSIAILHYAFYWAKARYEERQLRERYSDYAEYQTRSLGLWP